MNARRVLSGILLFAVLMSVVVSADHDIHALDRSGAEESLHRVATQSQDRRVDQESIENDPAGDVRTLAIFVHDDHERRGRGCRSKPFGNSYVVDLARSPPSA